MESFNTTASAPGHVFIVEDDSGLRESLESLLRYVGYAVRGWKSAEDFLDDLPKVVPAVLITDMRMPGMHGVDLHAALIKLGRTFPIIYISGESTVPQSIQAMKLGAFDFLLKPFGREELLKVVTAALEKDRRNMQHLIKKARFEESRKSLSPRQVEVHDLLLKGFGNKEICEALGVSMPTAKQYKSEVLYKLGARSLSELLALSNVNSTSENE
jgi:FixJ family two-component response regulator